MDAGHRLLRGTGRALSACALALVGCAPAPPSGAPLAAAGWPEAARPARAPEPEAVSTSASVSSAPPSAVSAPPAAASSAPSSSFDALAALARVPPDAAPDKIILGTHYVVSNEDRPQLFREAVRDRGGAYVGVGAEQGLLFAGWARSDEAFFSDFDDWVVQINEIHGIVLLHAKTPDDVVDLWSEGRAAEVSKLIDEGTPDPPTRLRRRYVFDHERAQVEYRLRWLKTHFTLLGIPFFANDQAELDHVAHLWREHRVRCVRGDLTAKDGAFRAFGDVARQAGWKVRVLYLSNAELYFDRTPGAFHDNLRALPYDASSIVIHTRPTGPTTYFYVWQAAEGYADWRERAGSLADLLRGAEMPKQSKLEGGAWLVGPAPAAPPVVRPPETSSR